jgi:hypothetical protein
MIDILIVNYNLPESVDEIMSSLKSEVKHKWIIVDNGSDAVPPHKKSTHFVKQNKGWMSGLTVGLDAVKAEYVWVLTTSMGAIQCEGDPIKELLSVFEKYDNAVMASPCWLGELKPKTHKVFAPSIEHYRPATLCSPSAFWKADFLVKNLERSLSYGWGTDFDLTYKARNHSAWVNNRVGVELHEFAGYGTDRRGETLDQKNANAHAEMERVLSAKYGPDWKNILPYNKVVNG